MNQNSSTIRRRWISISREGFSFLFVMVFILVGAVVRQVNLLFILAGLLIAAMIFNWRYAVSSIRKLSIERKLPELINAGQPLIVDLTARSRLRWLTCWNLLVKDRIQRVEEKIDPHSDKQVLKRSNLRSRATRINATIGEVPPMQTGTASFRCYLPERGEYRLGPVMVSTRFPLGLVWAFGYCKKIDSVLVAPAIGHLIGQWTKFISDGRRTGENASKQKSLMSDGDYYSIRPWQSGDSRHNIHWRSTAKNRSLQTRQTELQVRDSYAVLLDLWQPEDATVQDEANTELAASVAATVVEQMLRQSTGTLDFACSGETSKRFHGELTGEMRDYIFRHLAKAASSENPQSASCVCSILSHRPKQSIESISDETVDEQLDEIEQSAVNQSARLLVISTRPNWLDTVRGSEHLDRSNLFWIDVSSDELGSWFQLS